MSLFITGRDLRLFRALDECGILSTGQILRRFFPNHDRTLVLRRLRKLKAKKTIRSFFGLPQGELVWGLTETGARAIGSTLPIKTLNRNKLEHDLLCSDVKIKLEMEGIGSEWISSYALQRMKKNHSDRIPDWIFTLHLKEKDVRSALEIELHLKGKSRIRGILNSYLTNKYISFVWYIVPTHSFGQKILGELSPIYLSNGENRIAYSLIEDVFKDFSQLKAYRKNNSFLLFNFCKLKPHILKDDSSNLPKEVPRLEQVIERSSEI